MIYTAIDHPSNTVSFQELQMIEGYGKKKINDRA